MQDLSSPETAATRPAQAQQEHQDVKDLDALLNDLSVTATATTTTNNSTTAPPPTKPAVNPSDSNGQAHKDLERLIGAIPNGGANKQHGPVSTPAPSASSAPIDPNAPICDDCHQPVSGAETAVTAIGKIYHPHHFRCHGCQKSLVGEPFFANEDFPYCEKCINETVLLPKCAFCNEPIKGKCVNALEKHWHPDHFFCSQCGRHFGAGEGFLEKDGKAYCEEDYYNMFAPKCAACDKPILDEVISALGKNFHATCFVCSEPGCKLELIKSGNFFDYGGKPYCETHYHAVRGSLCASCQKPIVGRCLNAVGKKFHPEHFVCAFCKKQLANANGTPSTFKDKDGKPFCVACHVKLYG